MSRIQSVEIATMSISQQERAFFIATGARIAERRKAQGITQIQMAEKLGVSQQTINSYEVGRRRIPLSALPTLATLLNASTDELLGTQNKATKSKPGPVSKLHRQVELVSKMPRAKQKFVVEMLDTVIQQQSTT